jgi:hypothetical protein
MEERIGRPEFARLFRELVDAAKAVGERAASPVIGSVVQEPPACSLGIDDSSEPVGQREFARLLYIFVKAATEAERQVAEPIAGSVIQEPLAYRIDDACRAIGVSKSSLYELAHAGEVKLIRIAGRSLVLGESLRRLVHDANVGSAT